LVGPVLIPYVTSWIADESQPAWHGWGYLAIVGMLRCCIGSFFSLSKL
jgi:hypothetical protein